MGATVQTGNSVNNVLINLIFIGIDLLLFLLLVMVLFGLFFCLEKL